MWTCEALTPGRLGPQLVSQATTLTTIIAGKAAAFPCTFLTGSQTERSGPATIFCCDVYFAYHLRIQSNNAREHVGGRVWKHGPGVQ